MRWFQGPRHRAAFDVPAMPLPRAMFRELLLRNGIGPGDRVLDATGTGDLVEYLDFLGLDAEATDDFTVPGTMYQLVVARPAHHPGCELGEVVAGWLASLRPGGALVMIDCREPGVLTAFPGTCRSWSCAGTSLVSFKIASAPRSRAEWCDFAVDSSRVLISPAA